MSFESNTANFIGNLTADPELRFIPDGTPVTNLSVAHNTKKKDGSDITTFVDVQVWREQAENVAESLRKGDRVVVIGALKTRTYENKEGQTVKVTEIEADEVCPSLKWARVTVSKDGGRRDSSTPANDDDVPF